MANTTSRNTLSLKFPYFNDDYTPLAEQAALLRAPLFKDQPGVTGTVFRIASIRDFPEVGYISTPQREITLREQTERASAYSLEPFDVLITMVGTIGHVTIVPETVDETWIPATNLFVIRFHEDRPRKARAMYGLVKSPEGQKLFDSLAHGRSIQIVSKKQCAGLLLPRFNEEVLDRMEALWTEEVRLYEEGLQRIEESRHIYERIDDVETIGYRTRDTTS